MITTHGPHRRWAPIRLTQDILQLLDALRMHVGLRRRGDRAVVVGDGAHLEPRGDSSLIIAVDLDAEGQNVRIGSLRDYSQPPPNPARRKPTAMSGQPRMSRQINPER